MIPRAWLMGGAVALLITTNALTGLKAWSWATDRAEARHAKQAARLTTKLADATHRARTLQAAYLAEQSARQSLIQEIEDEVRADPAAAGRVPSDSSLRRLQRRWGTP